MRPSTTLRLLPALLFCLLASHPLTAADPADMVELFEAMKAGQIDVRFIPADEKKANVLITNKTAKMLHLEIPEAIAAVPVLAQFAQGGGQGFGQGFGQNGGGGGGGANQAVGGGFNLGGGGGGNGLGNGFANGFGNGGGGRRQFGGPGMGFMRIPPEKTRKVTATTVCLEYGKPEPHPRITYQLIPIEQFTDNPEVAAVCRDLGTGSIDQLTAQAIAWHLSSELSWDKLASLNRVESRYLGNIRRFHSSTLKRAKSWLEDRRSNSEVSSSSSSESSSFARAQSSAGTFN